MDINLVVVQRQNNNAYEKKAYNMSNIEKQNNK